MDYGAHKISWHEAYEKIQQVFRFKETIRNELQRVDPGLAKASIRKLWNQWNDMPTGVEQGATLQKYGHVLVQMFALNTFVSRNFLPRKK